MSSFRSADPDPPAQPLDGSMWLKIGWLHDPENLRTNPARVAP